MNLQLKVKDNPNCAVFSRHYQQHLDDAINEKPEKPVTFRSYLPWKSAQLAVKTHGKRTIYYGLGEDDLIRYKAVLEQVELYPQLNTARTNNLLENCLPSTRGEGLWEKDGKIGVKTLYVISHCQKLSSPFLQTELIKISDDRPINKNFIRSYALVYELEKS